MKHLKCCWRLHQKLNLYRSYTTMSHLNNPTVAIVGSGPAGFYTAQQILKGHPSANVDIYEKLPVPFGLVRFGVAPDHPEVKNVINTFTTTAHNERCTFIGNVNVGRDVSVKQLKQAYTAVVLSYGADDDKTFGLPGENLNGVLSARNFVGWYNGIPEDKNLDPNLDTDVAVVLGQGNVAVDVARILLTPIDILKKTDITEYALEKLSTSKIKRVYLVGRRGPMQVALTTAELREMLRLEDTRTVLLPQDFDNLEHFLKDVKRPRKRLTELLMKSAINPEDKDTNRWNDASREWGLRFLRSPKEFLPDQDGKKVSGVRFTVNKLEGTDPHTQYAVPTDNIEDIQCGVVFRSIGYKSISIDSDIPFDNQKGIVPNAKGRVKGEKNLYCSGWVKRGPVGVIVTTMNDGFETGLNIVKDLKEETLEITESQTGKIEILKHLQSNGVQPVLFDNWDKINGEEIKRGELLGKPREKVVDVEEMLQIAMT